MLPLFDIENDKPKQTIHFKIYDNPTKQKDKKRNSTIEVDFSIDDIMALTTAKALTPAPGDGKWPILYVSNYSEPLELPDQSFGDVKTKLIEASLTQYQDINIFIPVGPKVLVNYRAVFQVRKFSGEIILFDDQILDGLDAEMLTEYERLSEIEHKKSCKQSREGTRMYLEKLAAWQKEQTNKQSNIFTRIFGTLDSKMLINSYLVIINIILSLVLIIMIGILLDKL